MSRELINYGHRNNIRFKLRIQVTKLKAISTY